jgi:hypothetical protein
MLVAAAPWSWRIGVELVDGDSAVACDGLKSLMVERTIRSAVEGTSERSVILDLH